MTPTDNTGSFPADNSGSLYYDRAHGAFKYYRGGFGSGSWQRVDSGTHMYPSITAFTSDSGVGLFRQENTGSDATGNWTGTPSETGTITYASSSKQVGEYSGNFGYGTTTPTYYTYANYYRTSTTAFGSNDRTIAFWVRHTSIDSEPNFVQIGSHTGGTGMIFACGANATGQGRLVTIGFDCTWTGVAMPADGTWFHLIYSLSGELCSLYYNGALISTEDCGGALDTNATYLYIGAGYWNSTASNKYSAAHIDEVGIWSKALSAAEAATLYNAGGKIVI
tara:strand:- start:113 stop:949 length:837 start_codon:yes stop_codon:yes gene_type:complete